MSINQTITALPTPPTRQEPSTFDDRADAFLSAIPNLADEINLWTGELNTTQGQIQTSETNAANAAAASLASQTAAAISAASAVTAPGTSATSSTSLQITNGPKALTIQTGKDFVKGQLVSIASDADPSGAAMYGAITDYNATTGALAVNVSNNVGVGTFGDWVIGLIGSWLPVFYVADELAWHTVTADYSAVAGQRLFVDVSGGPLTITLPPIVSGVEWLEIICGVGDFVANPLTIARNGAPIEGLSEDMTVNTNRARFMLVVVNGFWMVIL
ncbi:MAG: hypothetical protein KZQ99_04415 [Candidatus Thiodiazotropha sp. (ex Dulcina madagascariensis)]|nr:hypothetical protein [Candidatus Thiodiazotropha sp. (ex Dulcina madagascariensis)]